MPNSLVLFFYMNVQELFRKIRPWRRHLLFLSSHPSRLGNPRIIKQKLSSSAEGEAHFHQYHSALHHKDSGIFWSLKVYASRFHTIIAHFNLLSLFPSSPDLTWPLGNFRLGGISAWEVRGIFWTDQFKAIDFCSSRQMMWRARFNAGRIDANNLTKHSGVARLSMWPALSLLITML